MTRLWRSVGIIVALAAAGCTTPAPARDVAADKAKLEADATSWFGFYAMADAEGMANLYAEDALLMIALNLCNELLEMKKSTQEG